MDAAHSTVPRILASGIDWLTATARPDERADELAHLAGAVLVEERSAGNRQREWQWRGYTGLSAGGCSYGSRRDGVIARLSGATASKWACPAAQLASNITRCDIQVTWLDGDGDADRAVMRLYRNRAAIGGRGRRCDRTILRPETTGPTLYAGRRSSDQFGRIYDKHQEQPAAYPCGAVRAEVELKGDAAASLRTRIGSGDVDGAYAQSFTRGWFERRGLDLPLPPRTSSELEIEPRAPTDAARTLAWLEKQVRPAAARSVDWNGLWPTLEALGLAGHVRRLL